ncbi:MAG: beta-ketoacyl-ACP synthase III [Fluviicola sp.]|nr:beta-ketoacyl-ACP synthase III [Fluviicola sp.]
MSEVYITRTSNFLPNDAISNDEMESYLGQIGERASKSRRIVLRNNGIENRYYALDKNGKATHSNAELTSLAVRNLMNSAEELKEIDLLTCGTSVPDQMMPSHAVMVHGLLPETNNIEVTSSAGICCSGMHALKYAYLSLKTGEKKKAVCTGSERLSRILHADHFEIEVSKIRELEENANLSFDKDFLRWMLSDGAGAFMLQPEKNPNGLSMRIDWIEAVSFANELETCMYMGCDKNEDGTIKSFMNFNSEEISDKSIFSIKQDVKLLGSNIVGMGFRKFSQIMTQKNIVSEDITHFLPHMSSYYFESRIAETLDQEGYHIPKEKWFTNLKDKGNVGAGSIYLMVDELFNSGKLKLGDKIILAVPESGRFSYVFSMLTVC